MKMKFKRLRGVLFLCVTAAASTVVWAQGAGQAQSDSQASRHFQLTMVLRYSTNGDGPPAPGTQTISTEVVIPNHLFGSSKTRMGSQVPIILGGKTTFVDIGTNFDCNNVHVEGDGLGLFIVLQSSRLVEVIHLKSATGVETEEPLITQRNVELSVKLPLNKPKVVFDSKVAPQMHPLGPLHPLNQAHPLQSPDSGANAEVIRQEPAMQIEMTAVELK